MPSGNGKGPAGAGPKTGRAMGICAGFKSPGYANPDSRQGRGMGRGRGRGSGRGRGFNGAGGSSPASQNLTVDQELEDLKGQADYFEDSLKETKQRIEELQSGK